MNDSNGRYKCTRSQCNYHRNAPPRGISETELEKKHPQLGNKCPEEAIFSSKYGIHPGAEAVSDEEQSTSVS
jgi:hypothetical protein